MTEYRERYDDIRFDKKSIQEAADLCCRLEDVPDDGFAAVCGSGCAAFLKSELACGASLCSVSDMLFQEAPEDFYGTCRCIAALPSHVLWAAGRLEETGWLAHVLDGSGRQGAVLFSDEEQKIFMATAFGNGEFHSFFIEPSVYSLPADRNPKAMQLLFAGLILWTSGKADSLQSGVDLARKISQ